MDEFLKDILGADVLCQEFNDFNDLNYLVIGNYEFALVEINEVNFLVITPLYKQPTIPTLVNHIKNIVSRKKLPVVYHPKSLTYSRMKGLIQHKVPFIVDWKQVYLPFLGTVLQKVSDETKLKMKFSLPAQLLSMMYLYSKSDPFYMKDAVDFLPYSAMSLTRAMRELESSDLFYVEKVKQSNVLLSQLSKQELFEELKERFNSPVWKSGYVNNECIINDMVLAGEDALAEKSMLANTLPVKYAVYKKNFNAGVLKSELLDSRREHELELWLYDPLLFSQDDIPDPISLVLSLKDVHDERVEQAIDEIMEEVWEGKHDTWIKQL